MKHALRLLLFSLALTCTATGQPDGMTGQWTEPTGSVIRIDRCGSQLCMWVVAIGPKAPSHLDIYNPDPEKRNRSLCGLEIGSGFVPRSPLEAGNGTLYDPKSGKTYHGQIKLDGTKLELRGYIGFPLFGETQTWTRPTAPAKACSPISEER
jgi:uncharacterized protein (DUF2147 family)